MAYSQYLRLKVKINDSNRTVIRKIQGMLSPEGKSRNQRARRFSFYREMIATHERAKELLK